MHDSRVKFPSPRGGGDGGNCGKNGLQLLISIYSHIFIQIHCSCYYIHIDSTLYFIYIQYIYIYLNLPPGLFLGLLARGPKSKSLKTGLAS